jgi:hypothetical protein
MEGLVGVLAVAEGAAKSVGVDGCVRGTSALERFTGEGGGLMPNIRAKSGRSLLISAKVLFFVAGI